MNYKKEAIEKIIKMLDEKIYETHRDLDKNRSQMNQLIIERKTKKQQLSELYNLKHELVIRKKDLKDRK